MKTLRQLRIALIPILFSFSLLLAMGARPAATQAPAPQDQQPPPPLPVTLVHGPYLQQPADRSMVVVWATREAGPAEVRYQMPGGVFSAGATSHLVANADSALGYDYYQHEASITGLSPSTSYSYQPFVGGVAAAPPAVFRTAPVTGSGAISFIAFGDSGTGSPEQRQLADLMSRDSFDFAMHVGDIAYGDVSGTGDASYATFQSFLFDVYQWLPSVPFVPVEGNHDSRPSNGDGKAYLDLFSLPRNGASASRPDHAERYYSFDYGPVHFIALDTEFTFQDPARRPEELQWLESDLAATQQPWKIAFYHRAPYSSGGEHGSDLPVRQAFGPILERYGVDLVLTGHEHDYERTVPIRESTTTTDRAIPYVVTGGGGAPLYPSGSSSWTAYSASRHEYVKIGVDACTLTLNTIGLDGGVFDSLSLSHCTTPPGLPAGWSHGEVGATGAAGSATASGGTFTVQGAGADVWGTADALHYAYEALVGDGTIVARVAAVQNVAPWTKAGVMIRGSLSPGSAQAFMLVSAGKGVAFQRRLADGNASVSTPGSGSTAPRWVKLTRAGNTISAFESADGSAWTTVATDTFTMPSTVAIGLGVSSHVNGTVATAVFDNVQVTQAGSAPNVAPSVALTSPAGGATATAPATFTLTAAASDSDGTIARVDFFAGSTKLATVTAAPYTCSWSNVAAGTYSLTAVATDNAAASTRSAPVTVTVNAPPPPTLPAGWSHGDVGATGASGNSTYANGVFTVAGAGADVWGTADAFQYAYRTLDGDGSIVARVASIQNVASWTKAGVMMRGSLSPGSAQGFMLVSSAKGIAFQRRLADGNASVGTSGVAATAPRWVKLARSGNSISAFESADGSAWTLVSSDTFVMGASIDVGLAVSSHVSGVNATATFDNVTVTSTAAPPGLPAGWADADVGSVPLAGNATFTAGTYSVTGSGDDVWGAADQFNYAYRAWTGDGALVAHVASEQNVSTWVKAGVMIRATLAADSAHAFMLVSPAKGTAFQRRPAAGGASVSTAGPMAAAPRWLKLVRSGNTFTAYDSADGVAWTLVGTDTIPMGATVLVGLAVTSHNSGASATATFDRVTIQ